MHSVDSPSKRPKDQYGDGAEELETFTIPLMFELAES